MIEALALRDLPAARPDRVAASGLALAAAERSGSGAAAVEARPLAPGVAQASPFDRQDHVEIRGNVRPLAADARIGLGAADEEGGGAAEGGLDEGAAKPRSALQRKVLAAYDPVGQSLAASVPGVLPRQVQAVSGREAAPPPPPSAGRKARQVADAFSAREPEHALGRLLDLAA